MIAIRHRSGFRALVACPAVLFALGCSAAGMTDALVGTGPVVPGATVEVPIQVSGMLRHYIVHVPPLSRNQLATHSHALLLVLHGSGQDGTAIMNESGMDSLADAKHFFVVYPDGTGGSRSDWNAGDCCGEAHARKVDDVAFLQAVIADIGAQYPVDRHRIYFAGFSDGARMAYSMTCKLAGTVAAVAAVSGSLTQSECQPGRAIPVIAFHGMEDESIPYGDQSHTAPVNAVRTAGHLPPTILFWLANNGCKSVTTAVYAQTGPVLLSRGAHCHSDVAFYTITNGTHTWPSSSRGLAVTASPLIASFLLAHTTP